MKLDQIIDTIIYENVGGAFIHGFTLPYCIASDVPRLIRNFKNDSYPDEVFKKGNFEEYNETHPEPSHRLDARLFGAMLSGYVSFGIIHQTDVTLLQMGEFMLATNLASLAYTQLPSFKKTVNDAWDLTVNAVNALGSYFI